jgi:ribokinase
MAAVHIVGSINVDLVAFCERLPRIGETVQGSAFERHPGGKGANQAVAAARAGAAAHLLGAVGNDAHGAYLLDTLRSYGVEVGGVETVEAPTGVALILVGGGDNQIVVVPGANARIDPARAAALDFQPGGVCVAQLEAPAVAIRAAFERARARRARALFNPAPALPEGRALFPLADVIVVNETECALFAGTDADWSAAADAVRAAGRALDLRADQALIVTLGAQGAVALLGDRVAAVPGHPVAAIDTTGAGDCFCGYLAAALARGTGIEDALGEANAAAALAVTAKGAAPSIPAREQVERFLEGRKPAQPAR